MITFILLFNFIFITSTFAVEIDEDLCERKISQFGNGEGHDHIHNVCTDLFIKKSGPNARFSSHHSPLEIIAHKNLIIIKDKTSNISNFIAGSSTEITQAVAIDFDIENQEIALLDQKNKILIFSSKITGNVAPKRTIEHQDLDETHLIKFLSKKRQIFTYKKDQKEVLIFSALQNSNGKPNEKIIKPSAPWGMIDVGFMFIHQISQNLFILNSAGNLLTIFPLSAKSPQKSIPLEKKVMGVFESPDSQKVILKGLDWNLECAPDKIISLNASLKCLN
jgi:hypothetical protein